MMLYTKLSWFLKKRPVLLKVLSYFIHIGYGTAIAILHSIPCYTAPTIEVASIIVGEVEVLDTQTKVSGSRFKRRLKYLYDIHASKKYSIT